ncbi:MAG: RNA polymerase sigma-70 factor [Bacteroidetes bacterium]|nr:RNA polymerase sigma-70 factor [Bacteroidota bacterium]
MEAFATIFRRYYAPLCRYAFRFTENGAAAEELVQELFYVLWRDRRDLAEVRSLKAYLYEAVRNRALHYIEHVHVRARYRQAVTKEHIDDPISYSPQEEEEAKELEKRIYEILGRLPLRRRRIFCMHRFEGKKYGEIANTLQVSTKTIEAEMHKALKTIKEGLQIVD